MNWTNLLNVLVPIIIRIVFTGLACLITSKIIPWLKNQYIWFYVEKFVEAADKLAETGKLDKGNVKKEYVVNCLKSAGINVDDTVLIWIEAAVREADILADEIKSTIKKEGGDL